MPSAAASEHYPVAPSLPVLQMSFSIGLLASRMAKVSAGSHTTGPPLAPLHHSLCPGPLTRQDQSLSPLLTIQGSTSYTSIKGPPRIKHHHQTSLLNLHILPSPSFPTSHLNFIPLFHFLGSLLKLMRQKIKLNKQRIPCLSISRNDWSVSTLLNWKSS